MKREEKIEFFTHLYTFWVSFPGADYKETAYFNRLIKGEVGRTGLIEVKIKFEATMKKEYYPSKKYEVFESKEMILIFRRTFFGLYRWIKSFNKEYYNYEEDAKMIIVVETNASNSNSSSVKAESFNKDQGVNQK